MYHNTNNETGETLTRSRRNAIRQEYVILDFFQRNFYSVWSPEMIHALIETHAIELNPCPITSVRRAITTLANAGYLYQTDTMVLGNYGKKVHTWGLK